MIDEEKKEVLNIDIDIIRNLRNRGMDVEANELLEAYRKDVKQQGVQARNDCLRKDKIIKKTKGICTTNDCWNKLESKAYCIVCLEKRRALQRKYYKNKKEGKIECQAKLMD